MAGIAIVLDLLRKSPNWNGQSLQSSGLISASLAASAAAASVAASAPFASRALFGKGRSVAYCDAGLAIPDEDYISSIRTASQNILQLDALHYSTKEYNIELKPLFSAFGLRSFALTSLRSFLLFYLPLLEPRSLKEEDDDDDDNFLEDVPVKHHVDLIVPLRKSVKQIIRETSVVTTRRLLERLAVHHASQRMAWKFLKDVPKSATRKAARGMPTLVYFGCVTRTTFRGHFLGVAASWFVQIGIEIYRFLKDTLKEEESDVVIDRDERAKLLGKKVYDTTVRCSASLVFASVGAGLGATLFRPSAGQWIGCALGDMAGPVLVIYCLDKALKPAEV